MGVLVTIVVASWEIECCAPPPVVGDTTSWRLTFSPDRGGESWPGRSEHEVATAAGDGRVLVDDVVPAHWREHRNGPRPPSARLWGELWGTVHGGIVPDDLPSVTGRVERVRVVRCRYTTVPAGGQSRLVEVPGTTTLADVRESPRWFTSPAPGSGGPVGTGVLVDVHIPVAPVEAPEPSS